MAHKAPRPCRFPGCPNTTISDDGYCKTHHSLANQKYKPNTQRTTYQHMYSTRWHKARVSFLRSNPLCTICLSDGRTTPATVIDHITPHKGDYSLFWDENNWQALCTLCHNKKTASEDGAFGNPKKQVVDIDVGQGLVY